MSKYAFVTVYALLIFGALFSAWSSDKTHNKQYIVTLTRDHNVKIDVDAIQQQYKPAKWHIVIVNKSATPLIIDGKGVCVAVNPEQMTAPKE